MKTFCIDCKKEIYRGCKRCKSCSNREILSRPEVKEKRKEIFKNNNPFKDKHHTEETKRKISKANSGVNNFWYGKRRLDFSEYLKNNNPNKNGLKEETKKKLSLKAKERFKNPKNHPNYINGDNVRLDKYSDEFTVELKEEIRKRDNYTCKICGMTEEEHLIVYGSNLAIHHIDYNKKNSLKNNLISLCFSCHMRTNFNRNYWMEVLKNVFSRKS